MHYIKTKHLLSLLILGVALAVTGCAPTFYGKWDADNSDHYPSISITENSSYVTVVLIQGHMPGTFGDLVSYSGVLNAPNKESTTGWEIQGDLEGDTAMQGKKSVRIHVNADGKTGTLRWRGTEYKIKRP